MRLTLRLAVEVRLMVGQDTVVDGPALELSRGELGLLNRILRDLDPVLSPYLAEVERTAVFRSAYERFKPGYDMINWSSLPFALPLLVALIVIDIPLWLHLLLLVPLIVLCVLSVRRMVGFQREVRHELEAIARRNKAVADSSVHSV